MKRIAAALALIFLLSTIVLAHGNEKHVMGMVTKLEGSVISVRTPSGEVKTVTIAAATRFSKSGAAATQQDLKVGDRVVIHAKANGDALEATEVKIGDGAPPQEKR